MIAFHALRGSLGRMAAIAVLSLGAVGTAFADYDYEPELDLMYGQASFGLNTVDIRFLPTLTIASDLLLTTDSFGPFSDVGAASPTVAAFFVPFVNLCGGPPADGCATIGGNLLVLQSGVDAVVFAHELGHDLGLPHDDVSPTNIMNGGSGFNDRSFTEVQAAAILSSSLVQTDALGKFIVIQTYNVVASVPEPSTYAMFAIGLVGVGFLRKRKASSTAVVTATA